MIGARIRVHCTIKTKLGVTSDIELVHYAIRQGLTGAPPKSAGMRAASPRVKSDPRFTAQ